MIYNLNIQESYLVFQTLKYIFSCDLNNESVLNTPVRLRNELNITINETKDIFDRELIISNDCKVKWIESIEFDKSFIFVLLNKELFKYFNDNFINFVKSITFDYKHISTLKFSELFFKKSKVFLTLNDLKKLDNNSFLYIYNIEKEKSELTFENKEKDEKKLKTLNIMLNLLYEEKSFDFYLQYLNVIKNDYKVLYNRDIVFKLSSKLINGDIEYGFVVKELLNEKNKLNNSNKIDKYMEYIKNTFISDKNKIFNFTKDI